MFFEAYQEQHTHSTDKKLKELQITLEKLGGEIDALMAQHGIDAAALEEYCEQEENFTSIEWQKLQELEKEHQAKLEALKTQVADPRSTRQKYAERSAVAPNWLFVR